MTLLLDIALGAGIAAACGIRPFFPALLIAALATRDLGVDFDGTDVDFLEAAWFMVVLGAAGVALLFSERRAEGLPPVLGQALAGLGAGLGALLFAGELAGSGHTSWPGIAGGVAAALLAQAALGPLFARTRRRLDPHAAAALGFYAEGVALVVAGLSVLAPPAAIVVLVLLAWLALTGRRREGEKYAGLRVLR